jgi:hypothetical protein
MISRRLAITIAALYAFLATLVVAAVAAGDSHHRVIGHGQIRFDGAGPELWAQRFRRQKRLVARLRMTLTARLDRVVWFVSSFQCIHVHEGSWSAHTGNGYFGGLQMDEPFQRTYGRQLLSAKGTADHWTPAEQIAVAIVAYESGRGFGPWPNTARKCGLR